MSPGNRIRLYLNYIFRKNQNGLTLDDIFEQVIETEGTRRYHSDWPEQQIKDSVSYDIFNGMAFLGKSKKEQHYLDKHEENSYNPIKWRFRNGKYYLIKIIEKKYFNNEKLIQDIKEDKFPSWFKQVPELVINKIFKEKGKSGLSYEELLEEYKKYFKFEDTNDTKSQEFIDYFSESSLFETMCFKTKPLIEQYCLDKIDQKSDVPRMYSKFYDWIYIDKKYYPFKREELTEETINANLRQSIRNTLAGQLGKNAVKNNLTNFEYLREFAFAMANITKLGIDEKYLEYLKKF